MKQLRPLFITILAFFIFLLLAVSPLIFGFGKTGKNTQVLGKDYSLLNKSEIISRLKTDFILPSDLTLSYEDRNFSLPLASISAAIDYDAVASDLLFRRLNRGIINYFAAFFTPKNFSLEVDYDSAALDGYLTNIAAQIDQPFIPSELSYESGQVKHIPGQLGRRVLSNQARDNIATALTYFELFAPVTIEAESIGSIPTDSEVTAAVSSASKLVGKSLEMSAPDQVVVVDDKTLISWVDFTAACRQDEINTYVAGLKTSLKKNPVEPVFKFEDNKVLEFRPAQNGYTLDDAKLSGLFCDQVAAVIASADKVVKNTFPVNIIEAVTANSDVNNLGIKELLGSGKSSFKHSNEIRNFNIEKGASIVNRILVAPGETFSFLDSLGDVSLENGFKKAYVINKGKTVLDVGGGICQVSTTLFRAMLNSGVDIRERQNHAYRVRYYEEDMPPGYDATVFIPSPDLKFVNDTGHHLLIQNTYDGKNKTLVYEIYGTNDGRKVEITNYRQWGYTAPPPDIYIDDPTLPAGKVIQDEQRIPGLKTSFDWKVTRDDTVVRQKTWTSNFVPWAAVFRRGPTITP